MLTSETINQPEYQKHHPGVLRVGIVPALRSHSVNEGLWRIVPDKFYRIDRHCRRLSVHDLAAT